MAAVALFLDLNIDMGAGGAHSALLIHPAGHELSKIRHHLIDNWYLRRSQSRQHATNPVR